MLVLSVVPFLYYRGHYRFVSEQHDICALLGCDEAFFLRVADICSPIWRSSFKNMSTKCCRFAESHMLTRSSLFWDVMQRILVVRYRRFGMSYPSHFNRQPSKELLDL
jgi:hypothetical protein